MVTHITTRQISSTPQIVPATTIRLYVDISIGVRLLNSSVRAWMLPCSAGKREKKGLDAMKKRAVCLSRSSSTNQYQTSFCLL